MKTIEFRMERPGLVQAGDEITVDESALKTLQGKIYYYTIRPALAMSGNIPAREKLNILSGKVAKVEESEGYWTIFGEFED